ncbi:MAG: cysteine hydrolase [Candidatus Heimdallarchaeum endolithica]|uniref:Cysteine hydrolase n=1 Tax=Candidatus Heimdallarchaeum endolithica TaxID=2876572 RepID=A0A9Y1BQQ9_9ARCH|nr:MAG: cysteine hydrolase [Candidatus Heimdallarchaeum endolithica]
MQKDLYLTEDNRKEKNAQWIEECRKYKNTEPFAFDLKKAALVVLDMQKVFLREDSHAFIPSGATIVPIINKLVAKFNEYKRPIIFSRHIFPENKETLLYKIWRNSIDLNQEESELIEEVKSGGIILIKRNYSAFKKTNLETILRKNKVKQVVVTGLMSHLCCDTTTRDAFMMGYEPFFVVDATATYNETLHLGTLRALSHGFSVPIVSEEIINWKENPKEEK